MLLEKNKEINLISEASEKDLRERHIIDCAQIIHFIDENDNLCTDIGSGSGLPGIVLAIIMKHKKSLMKFYLYEKSFHKSKFLKDVSNKLNLNTKIFQKNIFQERNLKSDLIVTRAFKPLPIILDLVNNNFNNFKSIILFLGKNGKEMLLESLRKWQFEYKEKMSLTSKQSSIIKIYNLKKRI
jgi:16S rRNA (guanine527-N7)-methyltransferase